MEASLKLARQFHLESKPAQPERTKFIARSQSYHGTTLGALSVGGHLTRRALFEPMLLQNMSKVSPCFAYRGMSREETEEQYVARLAQELDDEFQRLGPETVCAFVAEPVVGAVSIVLIRAVDWANKTIAGSGLRSCGPRVFQGSTRYLRQVWRSLDTRRGYVWDGSYRDNACLAIFFDWRDTRHPNNG